MHVLLLCESLSNSGGIERMTISLANELVERGFMISIVVCVANTNSFYTLDNQVRVYYLNCCFSQKIKLAYHFYNCVRKLSPDIIVNVAVPMGQVSFLSYLFLYKKPKLIAWEHFHLHAGSRWGYYFRLLSVIVCSRTVVLTERDRCAYPKWIQRKVECIYNFTSYKIFRKDFFNIENVVLAVGRLEYQKGYDELLHIWKEVILQQSNGWKLNIVGNGSLRDYLVSMANKLEILESIDFMPATQAVTDYYRKSSVFVMTSRFEGLPMVLLEAKTFGMPSVSYDSPNGPSEIIQDGIDGYIVRYGDRKLFATKLLSLMNSSDLQKSFSLAANLDVEKRFSIDVIIGQWIDLFNELQGNENTSCN